MHPQKKTLLFKGFSIALAVLLILAAAGYRYAPSRLWSRITLTMREPQLTRALLDEALELGSGYMLNAQLPEGNFTYEYDWRTDTTSKLDGSVRQAGALWGLSLLYQDTPDPALANAIDKGLAFFNATSRTRPDGARYVVYPSGGGRMGTVALVALAHIDYLRAARDILPKAQRDLYQEHLNGYLTMLVKSRTGDGRWHSGYQLKNGSSVGDPSSYFDGEALLALSKAARYLDRADLLPTLREAAAAGLRWNIREALKADPDSDVTKGYYQWSSMAFFELATSPWTEFEPYGDVVIELADWMIHTHHTLWMTRNTAYAQEGITHAYALARRKGDIKRMQTYQTVVDIALQTLSSWQVGHSLATHGILSGATPPARALGGVQNAASESLLRIDVVQHQMHAILLARRYVYPAI